MEVEKTIRVLLTAAEDKALHELAHQLRTYSNVRICNCVTDGMILRQAIKELKPDAILMEVLHAPCQNDALLSAYQQTSHRPPILFYGQRSTPLWMHKAAAYGTSYYLNKPASTEAIVARLHMLSDRHTQGSVTVFADESMPVQVDDRGVQACRLLKKIGIPPHLCGYRFLKEAIVQVCKDPSCMQAMTTRIYQPIAQENQMTVSQVERSMRYAIEYAFNRGNLDAIESVFGFTINSAKGKPSNSECIAMLADHLHRW